ncbi:hypothetical protein Tco_1429185 [Tanacetum coccineum]
MHGYPFSFILSRFSPSLVSLGTSIDLLLLLWKARIPFEDIDGIDRGCVSSFTLEMQVMLHNEIKQKISLLLYQALEKVTAIDIFYLRSIDEGVAVPAPDQAPAAAPATRTMHQRMARLEDKVHGVR